MSDTLRLLVSAPFVDLISEDTVTLYVDPGKPIFEALTVVHGDCETGATVSIDLDAFYCSTCHRRGSISGAWAAEAYDSACAEQSLGRAWSIGGKWFDQVVDVVVTIENWPHPPDCSDWDEDGCDCGIDEVLDELYSFVGAGVEQRCDVRGHVEDGHPLQLARLEHFDAWRAELGHEGFAVITYPTVGRFRAAARALFGRRA